MIGAPGEPINRKLRFFTRRETMPREARPPLPHPSHPVQTGNEFRCPSFRRAHLRFIAPVANQEIGAPCNADLPIGIFKNAIIHRCALIDIDGKNTFTWSFKMTMHGRKQEVQS